MAELRRTVLTTERLVVTTWSSADVDALHQIHADPETMRHVRHGRPEDRAEVAELIGRYRADQLARGWTKWRVADHEGALVGRAGFGGTDHERGISYLVRRDRWGRGLATEVASALVQWHRHNAPQARLTGLAAVGNDASIRVLHKVGFVETGRQDHDGTPCLVFEHPR